MVFQLTESLIDEILQALENQEETFVVDAAKGILVSENQFSRDDDSFYELPVWDSAMGFELREQFANNLHNRQVQSELKKVLHSGRGVFRSFKIELKKYPEIEKLWHRHQNKAMRNYVADWYNQLREIWGLEKLPQEPEDCDDDDLLHDDFIFKEYSSEEQLELNQIFLSAAGDLENGIPESVNEALTELWLKQFNEGKDNNQFGIVCRTLNDEVAGCITAAPVSEKTKNVVFVTSFFVSQKFRGLGIGTELLEMCLTKAKTQNKQWILIYANIPDSMEPLLIHAGFKKTGSGFSAEIQ